MSGFKKDMIPVYAELANEFVVMDQWFASMPASTQPNWFYVHSSTSHDASSNVMKVPPKKPFSTRWMKITSTLHIVKFHDYKLKFNLHAKLGKLPNYVVIEQRYFVVEIFPANDDHPSHEVALGQRFVKEVYETLRASTQWEEMVLLITYDDYGGFYDHVPTPVSGVPKLYGIIRPDPFYFGFDRLGVCVPTLLISPWIKKCTVTDECYKKTHEPAKILSTIDMTVSAVYPKAAKSENLDLSEATSDYHGTKKDCKRPDRMSNHLLAGVMTLVMGVVTMVRMTRNMPKRLTDAALHGSMYGVDALIKGHGSAYRLPAPAISSEDYFIMMKRMNELEEKVSVLVKKPATMPPEKEEMLNNAFSRVDALEQELLSTKKRLDDALVRQEELLAYMEKKKKRKKRFFAF